MPRIPSLFIGDPGRIRTCDLQLRRLLLYPLSYGAPRRPAYIRSNPATPGKSAGEEAAPHPRRLRKCLTCPYPVGHDLDTIFASNHDAISGRNCAPLGRIPPMFSLIRAGIAAALSAPCARDRRSPRKPPTSRSRTSDLADSAIDARSPDQVRCRRADQAGGANPARCRRRLREERLPRRHGAARPDRRRGAERRDHLAAAGAHHHADPPGRRSTNARCCSSAPRPRPISPISAPPTAAEEADSLALARQRAEPARSCGGRRSMRCGCRSNCARSPTCAASTRDCANSTASACSIIRSMPTPRRRAPASSSPKTCRRAPISRRSSSLAGTDKPALSAAEKQLCVEGLQHGESYNVTLRAGLPSAVHETLSKSAEFVDLCARPQAVRAFLDARPMCCRAPASAAFRSSASTRARSRSRSTGIGDRNLIDAIGGDDLRPRRLPAQPRAATRSSSSRIRAASPVWKGELAVDAAPLNTDVTTAFPVDQAVGELKPGVYVMVAQPQGTEEPRQRLRFAGDAMVHRFRSRPHRVLRQ